MKLAALGLGVAAGSRNLIRDLDFTLEPGQCWGILGRNGTGKTTLLHTLAGLHPPAAGEVRLDERPLASLSRRDIARRLGLMPQDTPDPFPATVLETALIGRHPHLSRWQWEGPADRRRAEAALAEMALDGLEARLVSSLSGGERRRLAFATLRVQDPPLLLLDEPTNHLDFPHQHALLGRLEALRREGRGVITSLHDVNLASRYCTHLLLLHPSGHVRLGEAGDILDAANLEWVYGLPFRELPNAARHRVFIPEPDAGAETAAAGR